MVLDRARALGAEIVSEPVALDYGQTRGLIRDLNGMVLDISTPTADLKLREDVVLEPVGGDEAPDRDQPEDRSWADFHPARAH